ncbi:TPA_asm: post-segregation killing protein PndC [Salmonella enterica subsp. diarizonae]|nr:post-segregation killing protein PndC [Salmonella enterica subsp. diarizonae]ELI2367692.1 post-segregation killing protein PndC [Salmonella enterica]HAB1616828.1 post-segregation killing protein PndC [Salmonella enterica subsp. diarizonae]
MATNCSITVMTKDHKFKTIYCHSDGYPQHAGKILLMHYNSQEKAEELISGGDISSLGERCDKPEGHSLEHPVKGYTVYYERDSSEENKQARTYHIFAHILNKEGRDYNYVFDGKKWGCVKLSKNEYIYVDDYCAA